MLTRNPNALAFVLAALAAACAAAVPSASLMQAPRESLPPSVSMRAPLVTPISDARVVVHKADRRLELFSGTELVRSYRVGLGFGPVGDKRVAGDGRTPEGEFYIFVKNPKSSYYLSLGVSYPNAEDAERGLRDGLITRRQHDAILAATREHRTPPQNTKLGGLIYIHGNGSSSDWTWGCVALEDAEMRELYDAVDKGTPVTILP